MKTSIEVVHNRLRGARLNLKRSDGQCLSLDFENEAIITNASGDLMDDLGVILDATEFLRIAMEFASHTAPVLSISSPVPSVGKVCTNGIR